MPDAPGPIRFTDILTTASSITTYLGEDTVEPRHVMLALEVLEGDQGFASLGRPLSPMVRRRPGGPVVQADLKALVQRWWSYLGATPEAELDPSDRGRLKQDLALLGSTT